MYDLLEQIKSIGRAIEDKITGKTVADEIENELAKHRILTVGIQLEPMVVRDALRVYNHLTAYNISDDEFDKILRDYAQYGLRGDS